MKQPVPARDRAPGSRRESSPAAPPQATLRVRYYRRMKLQRVYPLLVEVPAASASAGAQPVTIRPVIPGAQVVPAEHRADALRPGERFTFYVTPLARGRLPEPRVEVLQPGRAAQPIPLRMKAVRQRLTWLLLALTILVPLGIIYVTRVAPLQGMVPVTRHVPAAAAPEKKDVKADSGEAVAPDKPGDQDKNAPKPGDQDKAAPKPGDADKKAPRPGDEEKKNPRPEAKAGQEEKAGPPAGDAAGEKQPRPGRGGRAGGPPGGMPGGRAGMSGMPGMPRPGVAPAGDAPATPPVPTALDSGERIVWVLGSPGAVLTYQLDTRLKNDLPAASDVLPVDALAQPVKTAWDATVPPATSWLGVAYDILCNTPSAWFWAGLALLGLTLISCFTHRAIRASRRATVQLAPVSSHEALPLGPGEARPLTVEPA